jgi:putative holliday junction resolvase
MAHPLIGPIDCLLPALTAQRALVGLDVGTKTIGVAVADRLGLTSTALETIARTKFTADAERLKTLLVTRQIGGLIIGLPLNMNGTEGPRCQSVRQFGENLAPILALPIAFWDERWSTAAVTRRMIDADLTRAQRAKRVDGLAAEWILQGALDRLRALRQASPDNSN